MTEFSTIEACRESVDYLKGKIGFANGFTAIILGTGLGALAGKVSHGAEIAYSNIPHFPLSTVESHSGKLVVGNLNNHPVVMMQGRFHFYEGYTMQQVVHPVRVLGMLGARRLLICNAAGAINPAFEKGELMLVTDHINLFPASPLRGRHADGWGPRFPDMSEAYSPVLRKDLKAAATRHKITLYAGVYASAQGPMLETAAEYRMLSMLGADAVGMSTIPEVIVAHQMNLPVAAISVLTDLCDPDNLQPVSVPDIIATAMRAEARLLALFDDFFQSPIA